MQHEKLGQVDVTGSVKLCRNVLHLAVRHGVKIILRNAFCIVIGGMFPESVTVCSC